ncbi:aminotransferase class III-fold pyridoxal phosphate-dependent enzyme [Bradyrhizobium sp. 131]|uniref:aspartate aminotransferase family protein n=1 Tax=Bradyrhizobium sp. 131 TaxID=2782609 RepID=UPI001FFF6C6A|nr:aminotransferase class III-fold pyridoxal phosphate-dependent enzyme [Bradyrhizobium sp. 131]UPK20600.1 aminotransferase class III-fold pyridoxal phosphate-dependent enzyme [Bradyrhizobium sp. 131]
MNVVETLSANSALDKALRGAIGTYVARNPKSAKQHASACEAMPGGNTRTVLFHEPFPLTIRCGKGCEVFDVDGHRYFDFMGEYTAGLAGHSNAIIGEAVKQAVDNGLSLSGHTLVEAEFAAIIAKRFPAMELLRFTNSGTEATLLALTLARVATGKKKVMAFDGAYHGSVFTFKAAVNQVNVPFDWLLAPYNDAAAAAKLIAQHADDIAAVIVEPMQGSGGCIPAEGDFLLTLRKETEKVGALLVFDEVMTSRLAPGGLQTRYSIRPDLMTLGKYVAGGLSFGAFGGRTDLMQRFDPRKAGALAHAGTFNNNVLTMSAGVAMMTKVATQQALDRVNARGEALRTRLESLCREHHAPLCVTGIGSLFTIHSIAGPVRSIFDTTAQDQRIKELMFFDLLEQGIYLARRGMAALSFEIDDAACEAFTAAFDQFLRRRELLFAADTTSLRPGRS